ncbi:MAG: aldo/keto reductase [Caldilineales bacterium]|nr:aldo/keto reductase [Caldilineales bacterium]
MQYNEFARSGRQVSRIGFGAMGLNCAFGRFDRDYLIRSVLNSLEKGVNFIDTARTYGESEEILGEALKRWRGERPFIASKAAPHASKTNAGWGIPNPIEIAYPQGATTASVEESLRRLDIETIDLLQLHQYWSQYEDGHWLEELQTLKHQGKIRHIGVSVTDHRHDQAISIMRSGLIDSVQTIVNIFDPLAFDSLIPLCHERGVAVIARCVLDEGGLTGFLTKDAAFDELDLRDDYFHRGPLSEYMRRVDALRQFIPEFADSLAELAIKFALHHPGVTVVNVSMHIPEYADENIATADKPPLPDPIFDELRKLHRWLVNLYEGKYFPQEGEEVSATGFKKKRTG